MVPTQQRSRERFERILDCAAALMVEKGSDALTMSDVVERSGVGFGSLYQYFPDKTAIIATLAERYNAIGRACVQAELQSVTSAKDLHPALCRIVDGYYDMFLQEAPMRDIWRATQGDPALQRLDEEDGEVLSDMLREALKRIAPEAERQALTTLSRLTMTLIAAAVRHAITLSGREAERSLTLFKSMLPCNVKI